MKRRLTFSGPGGIFVEDERQDEKYADLIARQDEEDSPRQPAPDLTRCKCGSLYCGRFCRFEKIR